jgi:hypothetical protein
MYGETGTKAIDFWHSNARQQPLPRIETNMTDLLRRARNVKAIIDNAGVPKSRRATQALQALSGLQLTGVPADIRATLETNLVAVDRILRKYPLETYEDLDQMKDSDLQRILDHLSTLVSRVGGENGNHDQ